VSASSGAPPAPRTVLGLLREPRWVRGLVLAVVVALACVVLGHWQWTRRAERLAANAPLHENYDAAPVDVSSVLPADGAPVEAADVWTPVQARGTYDPDATVLVRNRPRDEQTGYEVLVPLVLDDGTALLVDRGWVPAGSSTARPDAVPAPPTGPVTVLARVRAFEESRRGDVPTGQVASIAQDAVGAAVAAPLLGGYALLASEDPSTTTGALPVRPDEDEGPHLAYTVQWFGFALTALVVWVVSGRRELENRRSARAEEAGTGPDPQDALPDDGRTTAPAPAAPPAVRTRLRGRGGPPRAGSDEEAEDAEVESGPDPSWVSRTR